MSSFSYEDLRHQLPAMNDTMIADYHADYHIEVVDLPGPVALFSYAAAGYFSILTLSRPPSLGGMSRIDIVGGGARGARATPALFEQLVTNATSDLQWGGPFASISTEGNVTFGTRIAISSGLLSPGGGGFAFMAGMIRTMGVSARHLALGIVAYDGGDMFTGANDDSYHLLAASRVSGAMAS